MTGDPAIRDEIRGLAENFHRDMVNLRRDIHAHPELGFQEVRTAAVVGAALADMDLAVRTGVAETGVVAVIEGARPGPTLMLRADMDALPIEEQSEVEYRSRTKGVMHACGHDGHTAVLLGAARVLSAMKERLNGRVVLVFQPAEENLGGARLMIGEGVLESPRVDAAMGLHLITTLPCGTVGVRDGPFMASVDLFAARIRGRAGHSAMPEGSVDAIRLASRVICHLEGHLSSTLGCPGMFLVNVGIVKGGRAPNVVADLVEMEGTVRCLDETLRPRLRQVMEDFIGSCCLPAGGTFDLDYEDGYPILVNDAGVAGIVRRAASDIVGEANVIEMPPVLASEDMAFYLREVPGCFFFVGAGFDDASRNHPHHSPHFDIDERSLLTALEVLCLCAVRYLGRR